MNEQTGGMQIRWPGNRVPATVLLDDPTPCRNPAWYEYPEAGHVAAVPNSFTERFADLIGTVIHSALPYGSPGLPRSLS